ncbi:hypothetical protein JYT22_00235 [Endomicrobium sp. AH-315-J14]|nr:hypothetical protein [Endomicrobium sp. AH-315-J14]
MSNDLDAELRRKIDAFAADLNELFRRQLEEKIQELLGSIAQAAPPAKKTAGKASTKSLKRATKKKRAGRRSAAELQADANRIHTHVKRNPGQSAEQIKTALGIATNQWNRPLVMLIDSKRLRRKGRKRAAKYTAVGK